MLGKAVSSPDQIERAPCPRCAELAPLAGRVCSHCGGSVLVNLRLSCAIADARDRYQAARALSALSPPFPTFLDGQTLLAAEGSVLARGLTRSEARALAGLVQPWGIEVAVAREAEPQARALSGSKGRQPLPVILASVAAVVVVGFVLNALRTGDVAPAPAEGPPSASVRDSADTTAGAASADTETAAQRALSSAVAVRCESSRGSGFFVGDGLVLTNAHVLCRGAESPEVVLGDGTVLPGAVERRDDWLDVALIRVRKGVAPPLALGDASELRAGARVLTVGSPLGLEFSVTQGILSHPERVVLGTVFLQVDAAVSPGSSGGPLTDGRGRAIGIVSMKVTDAEGLGLALPVNYLFEGEDPWLSRPAGASRERWTAVRERARQAELKEIEEARDDFRQPGLVAAMVMPDGIVRAVVARRSDFRPSSERFSFEIVRGGQALCRPEGEVASWTTDPDAEAMASSSRGARVIEWFRRNQMPTTIYYGVVKLPWSGCPDLERAIGAEVVLERADRRTGRTTLVPFG